MSSKRRNILLAALAIANEKGLAALSMRTVARRIGVSAMALYPHIGSKDALLDGMLEMMLADLPKALDDLPADDWWARLQAMANELRAIAHRNPGAFSLLVARPSVMPGSVRATDAVYQTLLSAGVPPEHVPRIERLMSTFVIGFALSEVNGRFTAAVATQRERRGPLAEEAPAHHALAEHLDEPVDWEAEFIADLLELRSIVDVLREPPVRSEPQAPPDDLPLDFTGPTHHGTHQ